jgi:hypothetical protein
MDLRSASRFVLAILTVIIAILTHMMVVGN